MRQENAVLDLLKQFTLILGILLPILSTKQFPFLDLSVHWNRFNKLKFRIKHKPSLIASAYYMFHPQTKWVYHE